MDDLIFGTSEAKEGSGPNGIEDAALHYKSVERKNQKLSVPRYELDYANAQLYISDDFISSEQPLSAEKKPLEKKDTRTLVTRENDDFLEKDAKDDRGAPTAKVESDLSANFELYVPDEEANNREQDELHCKLEADMDSSELPYHQCYIFQSSATGAPFTVGYLKYLCYVENTKEPSEKERTLFQKRMTYIKQLYSDTQNLVARVYILSVNGLLSSGAILKPKVFPWILNGPMNTTDLLSHNIRNVENSRTIDIKLKFNKCYALNCNLPEYSMLEIRFMSITGLGEYNIGSTFIDLENRWFHPKYQALLHEDHLPIEQRALKLRNQMEAKGTLRILIELLTYEASITKPKIAFAIVNVESYQLRVVVWCVKQVPLDGDTLVSLFVRGLYTTDEKKRVAQDTDVHYNSRDGSGRFNWRFIWDIDIPSEDPTLNLQIWNSYLFPQSSVILSECRIDLAYDYRMVRKKYASSYEILKKWYPCYHPSREEQTRGFILAEISILPKKEAEAVPVGVGRNEPNRNPHLEPVLENRAFVDWKNIQNQISDFAVFASTTARRGFYITVAIFIIGGIILLIILLR